MLQTSILRLLVTAFFFVFTSVAAQSESALKAAEKSIRATLVDPESAFFSELTYYSLTKTVCGNVNARNRAGGYVGPRRFVFSVEGGSVELEPSTELPPPPTAPSAPVGTSMASAMQFQLNTLDFMQRSEQWRAKVDAISENSRKFRGLVETGCTNDAAKLEAVREENRKKFQASQQFWEFKIKDGKIENYNNNYIYSGANLVGRFAPVLNEIFSPRGEVETTQAYTSRLNYKRLSSVGGVSNSEYGLVLTGSSDRPYESKFWGKAAKYDADSQTVSVAAVGGIGNEVCSEPRDRQQNFDTRRSYGVRCDINGAVKLLISNLESREFLQALKKGPLPFGGGVGFYIEVKFKLAPDAFLNLPAHFQGGDRHVGVIIVGRVQPDLIVQDLTWLLQQDIRSPRLPFAVTGLVFFNPLTGAVLRQIIFKQPLAGDSSSLDIKGSSGGLDQTAAKTEASLSLSLEQVREAQIQLASRGYDTGTADGLIGERTRAAIRQFQADTSRPTTGFLDGSVLRELRAKSALTLTDRGDNVETERARAIRLLSQGASVGGAINTWGRQITALIRDETSYFAAGSANPEARFRISLSSPPTAPADNDLRDCRVVEVQLVRSSGEQAWDRAAEQAIRKSSPWPRMPNGTCPGDAIEITQRPRD